MNHEFIETKKSYRRRNNKNKKKRDISPEMKCRKQNWKKQRRAKPLGKETGTIHDEEITTEENKHRCYELRQEEAFIYN